MLTRKLHLKPGMRFAVVNAPAGFAQTLGKPPAGVIQEKALKAALDLVLVFVLNSKELTKQWQDALMSLNPDGALWVAYPKKSSGIDTDLHAMNGEWDVYRNSPWQPVAMIAVDGSWSAVRFRQRPGLKEARAARVEEVVRDADGAVCIDRVKRIVTAPKDLQKLFGRNAKARAAFDALAFTHRKEYVVWILEAKKPETRAARLVKTVEMLATGKRNPSDK